MGHKSLNFTFEGESFREFVRFLQENFYGLLAFAAPKDAMPPNFAEKTFTNSHKIAKFTKVFSLESFPLYGIKLFLSLTQHYS